MSTWPSCFICGAAAARRDCQRRAFCVKCAVGIFGGEKWDAVTVPIRHLEVVPKRSDSEKNTSQESLF